MIQEELLHAYQDVFDRTYMRNVPPDGKGIPNIEVDAKLMIDIDSYRKEKTTGNKLHQKDYMVNRSGKNDSYIAYLKSITNDGAKIPSTLAELNTPNFSYADVLQMFKVAFKGSPYDKPIDATKTPSALLLLTQTCNCN